ncbi:MAG: MFS transporter [Nocardioidaceae bacterium]
MSDPITDAQPDEHGAYRRDGFTWAAFGALLAFGFLNSVLGPALPYLRAVEHVTYLVGALHQVAFAAGGGLAGLLATRASRDKGRAVTIRLGLFAAAIAGLGLGYGNRSGITVPSALLMSLFGTAALIRLWAALADGHGRRRTVAMAEGEVSVSLGGIIAPLLVAGLAATALGWRSAFVVGGIVVVVAVLASGTVRIPRARPGRRSGPGSSVTPARRRVPEPTLVVVFSIVALEFSLSFWLASYLNDSVGLSRDLAVAMVSGLYAANLVGRLVASRLARRTPTESLLLASIGLGLLGTPVLLTATSAVPAAVGLAVVGAGIGATFPLTSSLHVAGSTRAADFAMGQVLFTAAIGQVVGPLLVGAIAQTAGLRAGLLVLPALAVLAAIVLARSVRRTMPRRCERPSSGVRRRAHGLDAARSADPSAPARQRARSSRTARRP